MTEVNIIYGNDDSDVDIISVPDCIVHIIEELGQLFCIWLQCTENEFRQVSEDGFVYSICETEGFIIWLNRYICNGTEKATIVRQHTVLDKSSCYTVNF